MDHLLQSAHWRYSAEALRPSGPSQSGGPRESSYPAIRASAVPKGLIVTIEVIRGTIESRGTITFLIHPGIRGIHATMIIGIIGIIGSLGSGGSDCVGCEGVGWITVMMRIIPTIGILRPILYERAHRPVADCEGPDSRTIIIPYMGVGRRTHTTGWSPMVPADRIVRDRQRQRVEGALPGVKTLCLGSLLESRQNRCNPFHRNDLQDEEKKQGKRTFSLFFMGMTTGLLGQEGGRVYRFDTLCTKRGIANSKKGENIVVLSTFSSYASRYSERGYVQTAKMTGGE